MTRVGTAIERQIAATDKQIDAFAYELYGLTEDEIRVWGNRDAPISRPSRTSLMSNRVSRTIFSRDSACLAEQHKQRAQAEAAGLSSTLRLHLGFSLFREDNLCSGAVRLKGVNRKDPLETAWSNQRAQREIPARNFNRRLTRTDADKER